VDSIRAGSYGDAVTSERQLRANRANATHSTGPRSSAGKAVSRLNALKHGALSMDVVLPTEDAGAYARFADRVHRELRPSGEVEKLLVNLITAYVWRLRRIIRAEGAVLVDGAQELTGARRERDGLVLGPGAASHRHCVLGRSTTVSEERAQGLRSEEPLIGEEPPTDADGLGVAFIRNGEALERLSRYEGQIYRRFFKALEELRRLQSIRQQDTESAPSPLELSHVEGGDPVQ